MAKIDKLGRVVIPIEYRKKLGIEPCDEVDIALTNGAVTIKPTELRCCVCGGAAQKGGTIPLCSGCIEFICTCHATKENDK